MKTLLVAFLLAQTGFAAVCKSIAGKASFNGSPIATGQQLSGTGEVVAEAGSRVILEVTESDGTKADLCIVGSAKVTLDDKTPFTPQLSTGTLRARLKEKAGKKVFTLRTPTSVMAVRGTDFAGTYSPLLSEAEIVVFDGTVRFSSLAQPKDAKDVPKGYWGGIGGRYGKKIGDLIQLPEKALKYYDAATRF